ncbi:MAG: hypothetical protein J5544_06880 [Clostridia bacterium]|nr:hypothetical protein [Clostridia bacterium]
MKKLITLVLILSLVLTLSACAGGGQQATAAPAEANDTAAADSAAPASPSVTQQVKPTAEVHPTAEPRNPETDCDNRFVSVETDLIELDDMFLWRGNTDYLLYYDKAAADTGVLCGKPECMHYDKKSNRDCTGYVGASVYSLSYYEGKIWFVGELRENGSSDQFGLYRMEPDGSGKELLFSFNPPEGYAPQEYRIHRGRLYLRCATDRVTDGVPGMNLAIVSTQLETKDFRVDYEETLPDANPWSNYMRFIGDNVYFAYTYDEGRESFTTKVVRIDTNTGESELILTDGALTEPLRGFWIDRDGSMFFAQYGYDPDAMLYRSENRGTLEATASLHDEDGRFSTVFVGDGVFIGIDTAAEDGDENGYEVWLRDFGGNTLYKGPLTTDFLAGTEYESGDIRPSTMTGDTDCIFWVFTIKNPNAAGGSSPYSRSTCFLVRYKLTANGLEEQPLIMADKGGR